MLSTSHSFKANVKKALADEDLRRAIWRGEKGFIEKRSQGIATLAEFEQVRAGAKDIKDHTLANLDYYLQRFEENVIANGGRVHWAATPAQARRIIAEICRDAGAKRVTKGKSMVGEEIGVNEALEAAGMDVLETDLGEYIIQLAKEPPSHIIAPAIHKTRAQVTELFHKHHQKLGLNQRVTEVADIVNEARTVLRQGFLNADVGITGANFLVAETGSSVIVTNEGNGDLTNTLPAVHIVTAGIEKVIPTLEDVSTVLRLLGRSATGQEMACYTTFSSGPKRTGDKDGPRQYHVVLLDNGRSKMLSGEFRDMLRCIRCGCCLNHCPVYATIGGHAYGWVYSGPMGSVLTPLIVGLDGSRDLPQACSLNGRCAEVCPMSIPLPDMLRRLRARIHDQGLTPPSARLGLALWAWFARRPAAYGWLAGLVTRLLAALAGRRGKFSRLPFAAAWTADRDLMAPQGTTFQAAWRRRKLQ